MGVSKPLINPVTGKAESQSERRRRYREDYRRRYGHYYRWSGFTKAYTREVNKQQRLKLREDVLSAYGKECQCCGETNDGFLTIDHIHGGGRAHRLSVGGSNDALYRWLRKTGYPAGFRTLCFNCNCGRSKNGGICPHLSY